MAKNEGLVGREKGKRAYKLTMYLIIYLKSAVIRIA